MIRITWVYDTYENMVVVFRSEFFCPMTLNNLKLLSHLILGNVMKFEKL